MPSELLVREFMTKPVTSLPSTAHLLEAALMLRANQIRHIPVVDNGKLVGILTDRDIHRYAPSILSRVTAEEYNSIFENTLIARVMTRDPQFVTPDTPLNKGVSLLHSKKLGCLPVLQGDEVVGIITVTDMLTALQRLLEATPGKT
jgi:CBS domain-containing protein